MDDEQVAEPEQTVRSNGLPPQHYRVLLALKGFRMGTALTLPSWGETADGEV
jgi:hypothetical protein